MLREEELLALKARPVADVLLPPCSFLEASWLFSVFILSFLSGLGLG